MLRPHCDRCDALCDEHQTWVEDRYIFREDNNVTGDRPLPAFTSHVWHIDIHGGGGNKMFCRACRIAILEAHVKGLKEKQT